MKWQQIFEEKNYRHNNSDVAKVYPEGSTYRHVENHGLVEYLLGAENRHPFPALAKIKSLPSDWWKRYLEKYPVVKQVFGNTEAGAQRHFIRHGYREGRNPYPSKTTSKPTHTIVEPIIPEPIIPVTPIPPKPPPPPPKPVVKRPYLGVSDPYMAADPTWEKKRQIIRANKSLGLDTVQIRLLVWHQVDHLKGKEFNAYRDWRDARSGFNAAWWDALRQYVVELNNAGIKPIIYLFDFWASYRMYQGSRDYLGKSLDPFTFINPGAYNGDLLEEQKTFIRKTIAALKGCGIRAWSEGNEGQNNNREFPPSTQWRQSFLNYIRPRVTEPIGCYHDHGVVQPGFAWADKHRDALHDKLIKGMWVTESGATMGNYCAGPNWYDCWGGGATQKYYEALIRKCIEQNIPYSDAFWQWDRFNEFAPRQIQAFRNVLGV